MKYLLILLAFFYSCRRCGDCEQHEKVVKVNDTTHEQLVISDNIVSFYKACEDAYNPYIHEKDTIGAVKEYNFTTYTIRYKLCK